MKQLILITMLLGLSHVAIAEEYEPVSMTEILNQYMENQTNVVVLTVRIPSSPSPSYWAMFFHLKTCMLVAKDFNRKYSNAIFSCEKHISKEQK